jgi:Ca2+-binding EF-hand superfamily protein
MGLGIYVPDEELPALMKSFDPDNSGFIRFEIIYDWFKKMSATEIDEDGMDGGASKK